MRKSTLRAHLLGVLAAFTPIVCQAQTGNPYYNVMDPAYGAHCDGSTHFDSGGHDLEAKAFQDALNAANINGGGVVFIPSTVSGHCVMVTSLNLDRFVSVSLVGAMNGGDLGQVITAKPVIEFVTDQNHTSLVSPLISAKSTFGVRIQGLGIQVSAQGFEGVVIDTQHAPAQPNSQPPLPEGNDTSGDIFRDLNINGNG